MADGARSGVLGFLAPERVEFTDVHVGRGGSGIVTRGWLKVDAERRIAVAIKALAPGATDREIRQFQKEFTISWNASQRCPGACVIYGCCHRGTDLCLVMCEGLCANTIIKTPKPTPSPSLSFWFLVSFWFLLSSSHFSSSLCCSAAS